MWGESASSFSTAAGIRNAAEEISDVPLKPAPANVAVRPKLIQHTLRSKGQPL
jgi:hypothetical protein